jgi:hypothetical protein
LFRRHFPSAADANQQSPALNVERAYAEAYATMAADHGRRYLAGDRAVVVDLELEEANLLHGVRIALTLRMWPVLGSLIRALLTLYDHTGRQPEAIGLVADRISQLTDSGRQANSDSVADDATKTDLLAYLHVQRDRRTQHLEAAEDRQIQRVKRLESQAQPFAGASADSLTAEQKACLNHLAEAYALLGDIQLERSRSDCVGAYQRAIDLYERLNDHRAAAGYAMNLGSSYQELPFLNDLDQAERWFEFSLAALGDADTLMAGRCFIGLGAVAFTRLEGEIMAYNYAQRDLDRARQGDDANEETNKQLAAHREERLGRIRTLFDGSYAAYNNAGARFVQIEALSDLADLSARQGELASTVGQIEPALRFWREAVRRFEAMGNRRRAGEARLSIAGALTNRKRFADAREYAAAALLDFEATAVTAENEIQTAKRLINRIDQELGSDQVAYDKVPTRDPYFPIKSGGRHVKLFKSGSYIFSCFTDFDSPGMIQYVHIMYVFEEGRPTPIFAVAAESMRGADYCMLCSFDGDGHSNYGASDEWRDLEHFTARALEMAAGRYGVAASLEEIAVPNIKPVAR